MVDSMTVTCLACGEDYWAGGCNEDPLLEGSECPNCGTINGGGGCL